WMPVTQMRSLSLEEPSHAQRGRHHASLLFAKGQNVNKKVYLDVMQTVVKPWMTQIAAGIPYLYQQDGAPAHTSNLLQNWCLENLDMFWSKEFWPPSSPDLNPLRLLL
ncbi:Transposable element tcb2 transposase, partial [Caligus rogercresseyi]